STAGLYPSPSRDHDDGEGKRAGSSTSWRRSPGHGVVDYTSEISNYLSGWLRRHRPSLHQEHQDIVQETMEGVQRWAARQNAAPDIVTLRRLATRIAQRRLRDRLRKLVREYAFSGQPGQASIPEVEQIISLRRALRVVSAFLADLEPTD